MPLSKTDKRQEETLLVDRAVAQIDALFLDFVVDDVEDSEWTKLQDNLALIIRKVKDIDISAR